MYGGIYICNKNPEHRLGHFSSEDDKRLGCIQCDGWMMLEEQPEAGAYKKPNIIWLGVAHIIWFLLKPISNWLDKHDRSDDE